MATTKSMIPGKPAGASPVAEDDTENKNLAGEAATSTDGQGSADTPPATTDEKVQEAAEEKVADSVAETQAAADLQALNQPGTTAPIGTDPDAQPVTTINPTPSDYTEDQLNTLVGDTSNIIPSDLERPPSVEEVSQIQNFADAARAQALATAAANVSSQGTFTGDDDQFDQTKSGIVIPHEDDEEVVAGGDREPYEAYRHKGVQRFVVGRFEFLNGILKVYSKEDDEEFRALYAGLSPVDQNRIVRYNWKAAAAIESDVRGTKAIRGVSTTKSFKDGKVVQ